MWHLVAALSTLAIALAIAYHLHLGREPARALQAVRRAREAPPLQGLWLLRQELLLGAGSCLPRFEGRCVRRQGRYPPEVLLALLEALGDSHARLQEHGRAREAHEVALEVKLEREAGAEELAAAYAALAADEMTPKLEKKVRS